jgi:hypothetical protein
VKGEEKKKRNKGDEVRWQSINGHVVTLEAMHAMRNLVSENYVLSKVDHEKKAGDIAIMVRIIHFNVVYP